MASTNPCGRSWTKYPSDCPCASTELRTLNAVFLFFFFFFFQVLGHEPSKPILGQVLG